MVGTQPVDGGMATDPFGVTGRLCDWLVGLRFAEIPLETVERAKDLLLDGIGCALIGAQLPWSRTAVRAVESFEGFGVSPVWGWGSMMGGPAAVLLNSTFIQGFELDDVHFRGPLHSASLILPPLFALAAERELGGPDLLTALVAGCEVGPRVGMSLHGQQMLSRGWHSGAVFGTLAATAATGTAIGLGAASMEDALGLAATQSGGLMAAQFEAMSKRMHHGFAARAGYSAAMLAAAGYTGIKRVFERPYGGFLSVFGEGHDPRPAAIVDGLGERWETGRIAIKPYAAMGALHGPLDAILGLRARRPLMADEIHSVTVGMSHAQFHHGYWEVERPLEVIGAQMHVGYALAVAILDGAAMARQFSPDRIDSDDVWALLPKITAYNERSFDTDLMSKMKSVTTVRFKNGGEERIMVELPSTYARQMPRSDVLAKFRELTAGIIDQERAGRIEEAVMTLERAGSAAPLLDLLRAPVLGVFD